MPSSYQKGGQEAGVAAAAAAIVFGHKFGWDPMISLTNVTVVNGRPTLGSQAMAGLLVAAGHELVVVESTSERCTVKGRRRSGTYLGEWQEITWTIEDAERAKLTSKDNWQYYPAAMLRARATAAVCRIVAPEVVSGLMTPEEARDAVVLGELVDATPKAGGGGAVRELMAAAAGGQVQLPPAAPEPEPEPAPATEPEPKRRSPRAKKPAPEPEPEPGPGPELADAEEAELPIEGDGIGDEIIARREQDGRPIMDDMVAVFRNMMDTFVPDVDRRAAIVEEALGGHRPANVNHFTRGQFHRCMRVIAGLDTSEYDDQLG